jgi:hypothetical protein
MLARCSFSGVANGPFSKLEGPFTLLMCFDCQAARGHQRHAEGAEDVVADCHGACKRYHGSSSPSLLSVQHLTSGQGGG